MKYKHRNEGTGIITIYDSNGTGYTLLPGNEVEIDIKREGNGVVVVDNESEKFEKSKKDKNKKGVD